MIPQIVHTRFELWACTVKLKKLCEADMQLGKQDLWLYIEIAHTQHEIEQLNQQLKKHQNNLKYN